MARAEINLNLTVSTEPLRREVRPYLAAKMICMEGATAIMHLTLRGGEGREARVDNYQVKKRGIPATIITCRRPNLAERYPPTRQAGSAATR